MDHKTTLLDVAGAGSRRSCLFPLFFATSATLAWGCLCLETAKEVPQCLHLIPTALQTLVDPFPSSRGVSQPTSDSGSGPTCRPATCVVGGRCRPVRAMNHLPPQRWGTPLPRPLRARPRSCPTHGAGHTCHGCREGNHTPPALRVRLVCQLLSS